MPNLTMLIGHWGYWAILLTLLAGNLGVPVPEEAVLILSGYLVWKKKLWLPAVLIIAILSAIAGDNLGYWVGRRYGNRLIDRYGRWALMPAERFDRMRRMVTRYGPIAVFFARFLPGLRFMAGPLAGSLSLPLPKFFVPNVLGTMLYVPLAVAAGYALGYGFGGSIEQFRHVVGEIEHVVLAGVIVCTLLILGSRAYRAWAKRNI